MLNKVRQEILDLPRSVQETLEKGRSEYEAVVRHTRWGEGPGYFVGSGPSLAIALTGVYAFSTLLGWPAIHQTPETFEAYALPALRPRSVVLFISPSGEEPAILSAAEAARLRGAQVLALTAKPESALARSADGHLLFRRFDQQESGMMSLVCQQAAISSLGLVAAQALKRPQPFQESVAAEFDKLPGHIEWVLTQLADVVRSFVSELKGLQVLEVIGGGFYHPTAWLAALLFSNLGGIRAQGWEASDFISGWGDKQERDSLVLCLSGSRCRLKKVVHQAAAHAKAAGARVLSVTDASDRELSARSALSVLVPGLTGIVAAPLMLALFEWVIYQTACERAARSAAVLPANSRQAQP